MTLKKGITLSLILMIMAAALMGCSYSRSDSGAYDKAVQAYKEGDYDSALTLFMQAADTDKREAESCRGEGLVYLAQGKYDAAVKLFDMSLKAMEYENEDFTEDVLYYKGEALYKGGNEEQAISVYTTLTEGKNPSLAYALMGRAYLAIDMESRADEAFDSASENGLTYDSSIIIYDALKDVNREADGAAYLEMALDIEPSDADDYEKVGKIYYYLENNVKAKEYLNTAVSKGCTDAVPLLGKICLEDGDVSEAKEMYLNAMNSGADAAQCYNGLALCEEAVGNYGNALTYIESGLETAAGDTKKSLLFNKIAAYEGLNDFASAKQQALEFLKLYPGDEAAKREYKYLKRRQD